jgi:hypothetical protein
LRKAWLHSPGLDSLLILAPPFAAVAFVWLGRGVFDGTSGVPPWAWIAFVLCIDVAHVYGTLFRTYLDPARSGRALLTLVPVACWLVGVALYAADAGFFWSALAYLAVFHFIRQQYGFLRLYSRHEPRGSRTGRGIDHAMIYLATGYPILDWHARLPRNFHWFVEGDFRAGLPRGAATAAGALYAVVGALYLLKEARVAWRTRRVNLPKQAVVLGTALSWYVGIVLLNGDMAFTIINVVSHGLPYVALVWIVDRRRRAMPFFLPIFLATLLALAFFEEGLWDGLLWREHPGIFGLFAGLPRIGDPATLAWLVPLLALPQSTHYVLDGFIWRTKEVA